MAAPPVGPVSRRAFLGLAAPLAAPLLHSLGPLQDSLAGRGDRGTLRDPAAAGRPRSPTVTGDNDPEIQAIEQRLACSCGCTLDVFTCRTTDFTCTYSPKLHREVLALRERGLDAQAILDDFVARYGEKALMAPKPEGFNLAGYLVPGAAIATAGGLLVWLFGRRRAVAAAAGGATVADGPPAMPGATTPAPVTRSTPAEATPEELERLRRALDEVES
jgi:cytochrome c-type biogenesis protein CcmH